METRSTARQLQILVAWLMAGSTIACAENIPAQPAACVQQGGLIDCRLAIPGAWQYRVQELYNDLRYASEAEAYAYLLRVREPTSVFALVYRWTAADPMRYPTTRLRSFETSSWKVFQRCNPREREFDCETRPEYMAYQRIRNVTCPAGYRFGADRDSPYCLPTGDGIRAQLVAVTRSSRR